MLNDTEFSPELTKSALIVSNLNDGQSITIDQTGLSSSNLITITSGVNSILSLTVTGTGCSKINGLPTNKLGLPSGAYIQIYKENI